MTRLERMNQTLERQGLIDTAHRYKAQRDELLAALEAIQRCEEPVSVGALKDMARSAIAKAKASQ